MRGWTLGILPSTRADSALGFWFLPASGMQHTSSYDYHDLDRYPAPTERALFKLALACEHHIILLSSTVGEFPLFELGFLS